MLFTRGQVELGRASYASLFAIERSFRLFAVERSGMVWDSRFVRARERVPPDRRVVYFLLDGWLRVRGADVHAIDAPAAFVASQASLEGAGESGFSLVSGGSPLRTLQVTVAARDLLVPTEGMVIPVPTSPALVEAARRVVAAHGAAPHEAIGAFFDQAAVDGLLRPGLAVGIVHEEDERILRVWNGLSASTNPGTLGSHQDIGMLAGLSTRHVSRVFEQMRETFGLDWEGWRVVTNDLRLRFAVLLLSADGLSVAGVARASGYGSTNALALAFRRAGLPSPTAVRAAVLGAGGWAPPRQRSLPLTGAPAR